MRLHVFLLSHPQQVMLRAKKVASLNRFVGLVCVALAMVFAAGHAEALVVRPAIAGIPGLTVTPGFSMSFYVPKTVAGLPNPDSPTNASNTVAIEQFLERPAIIGRDVIYQGKGLTNRKVNPAGQIFFVDLKSMGVLTFFYPTITAKFTITIPRWALPNNSTNIAYEIYTLAPVTQPPDAVPVPPAGLLLFTGLVGIAALGRKRGQGLI
jgi:hypothetical protein